MRDGGASVLVARPGVVMSSKAGTGIWGVSALGNLERVSRACWALRGWRRETGITGRATG